MDMKPKNQDLIMRILEDQEERAIADEEIIRLLLDEKLSRNVAADQNQELSFRNRLSDSISRFVGSWSFIIIFMTLLLFWILLNTYILINKPDPFPFILLNLMLSMVAAIQAPIIMMSQNRQEEKDRLRSLNDYKTNLKSEIIIEEMYQRIEMLAAKQEEVLYEIQQIRNHIEK